MGSEEGGWVKTAVFFVFFVFVLFFWGERVGGVCSKVIFGLLTGLVFGRFGTQVPLGPKMKRRAPCHLSIL